MDIAAVIAGIIAALFGQTTKNDHWSRWVTILYVATAAFVVSALQSGGRFDVWQGVFASIAALGAHSALLNGTRLGRVLKWDLLAKIARAIANVLEALAREQEQPKAGDGDGPPPAKTG